MQTPAANGSNANAESLLVAAKAAKTAIATEEEITRRGKLGRDKDANFNFIGNSSLTVFLYFVESELVKTGMGAVVRCR